VTSSVSRKVPEYRLIWLFSGGIIVPTVLIFEKVSAQSSAYNPILPELKIIAV
jgi:hypothetical protein